MKNDHRRHPPAAGEAGKQDLAVLGPTLPALAEQTGAELGEISFLFTARSLGYIVGALLGGRLLDRLRGHPVLALSLGVMALALGIVPLLLCGEARGILFFDGVPAGEHELVVRSESFAPSRASVRAGPGAPSVTVVLRPGGRIAVRAITRGGLLVEGASVEILNAKGEDVLDDFIPPKDRPTRTLSNGRIAFDQVPPGEYRVAARRGDVRSTEDRATIEANGISEVLLLFP